MDNYDCTDDVMKHKSKVEHWLASFWHQIKWRTVHHDESKLGDPVEKEMFDQWTPKLKELTFGSDEYKQALEGMGVALKRHYAANRHHPEHFANGVNGMTLVDIMEMVADWMAAAENKNTFVDLDYLAKRFNLSEQLVDIIANTLLEEDVWNAVNGVPVVSFCPPDKRNRHVDGFVRDTST